MAYHAALRAKERLGVDLTDDDLSAIADKIRTGNAFHLRDVGDGVVRVLVTYMGVAMSVVFDPAIADLRAIKTVMEPPTKRAPRQMRRHSKGRGAR